MIHAFTPLTTYSSPDRSARADSAAASEPACGSESAYAPSSSPPSMSGSQRARCSSVPYSASAKHDITCTDSPTPIDIQAVATSSSTCR